MTTISWWRSWHGAPMDHKWPVIAARAGVKVGIVSAVAWALMDYASQQDDRGSVDGFDEEAYAVYSGFSQDEIHAVIVAMQEKDFILNGRLCNWEKRQPKREDASTDRVTRYREMKRSVTQCNADDSNVTPQIKIQITDTDTDKDKECGSGGGAPRPAIYGIYESEIGPLTAMIADHLDADVRDYTEAWVIDAIGEAVKYNARSLAYVEKVLQTRKRGGGPKRTGQAAQSDDEFRASMMAEAARIEREGL